MGRHRRHQHRGDGSQRQRQWVPKRLASQTDEEPSEAIRPVVGLEEPGEGSAQSASVEVPTSLAVAGNTGPAQRAEQSGCVENFHVVGSEGRAVVRDASSEPSYFVCEGTASVLHSGASHLEDRAAFCPRRSAATQDTLHDARGEETLLSSTTSAAAAWISPPPLTPPPEPASFLQCPEGRVSPDDIVNAAIDEDTDEDGHDVPPASTQSRAAYLTPPPTAAPPPAPPVEPARIRDEGASEVERHEIKHPYMSPVPGYLVVDVGDAVLIHRWEGADEWEAGGWCYGCAEINRQRVGWLPQRCLQRAGTPAVQCPPAAPGQPAVPSLPLVQPIPPPPQHDPGAPPRPMPRAQAVVMPPSCLEAVNRGVAEIGSPLARPEPPPIQVDSDLQRDILHRLQQHRRSTDCRQAIARIQRMLDRIYRRMGGRGSARLYGSYVTNLRSASSTISFTYFTNWWPEVQVPKLYSIADGLPQNECSNITTMPLLQPFVKFTDNRTGVEVDFCFEDTPGLRQSQLFRLYARCDDRLSQLAQLVDEWSTKRNLVETSDGLIDNDAFTLMVIQFLQTRQPFVLPNLHQLAAFEQSIQDLKCGCVDAWDTGFVDDVPNLPESQNRGSAADLLVGFFQYYATFDWQRHAVSIRLSQPGTSIDKHALPNKTPTEMWYIEDPFNLGKNYARKCSHVARQRLVEEFRRAARVLTSAGGWKGVCPDPPTGVSYLKSRIAIGVEPPEFLEAFRDCGLTRLHFPRPDRRGRMGPVYLAFPSNQQRRRAHAKNEIRVGAQRLYLHYSSEHGLNESLNSDTGSYEVYVPSGERVDSDA